MSSTLVDSSRTSTSANWMSMPPTSLSDASGASTSSRTRLSTVRMIGSRNVSRSPGQQQIDHAEEVFVVERRGQLGAHLGGRCGAAIVVAGDRHHGERAGGHQRGHAHHSADRLAPRASRPIAGGPDRDDRHRAGRRPASIGDVVRRRGRRDRGVAGRSSAQRSWAARPAWSGGRCGPIGTDGGAHGVAGSRRPTTASSEAGRAATGGVGSLMAVDPSGARIAPPGMHGGADAPSVPVVRITIAGSSGLIGTALVDRLRRHGHQVTRLVRGAGERGRRRCRGTPPRRAPALGDRRCRRGGEPRRRGYRRPPMDRRVQAAVGRQPAADHRTAGQHHRRRRCRARRCSSAGRRSGGTAIAATKQLDESSAAGTGFLADLCVRWEAATLAAADAGTRVAHLRTGIVLSAKGGALKKQLPLFKLGLGGQFGSGEQWQSWISIDRPRRRGRAPADRRGRRAR